MGKDSVVKLSKKEKEEKKKRKNLKKIKKRNNRNFKVVPPLFFLQNFPTEEEA